MPPLGETLDDDYVIGLLKKDAAANQKRSLTNGLGSLLSRRPTGNAPKPNTRFLKSIIRETDSHNAALKAKEEEDSKAKLKELRGTKRSRDEGAEEGSSKRRRGEEKQGRWANVLGGLGGAHRDRERKRKESDTYGKEQSSRRKDFGRHARTHEGEGADRIRKHKSRTVESKNHNRSPAHRKEHRRRSASRSDLRSRSPTRNRSQHVDDDPNENSDSDPLDDVLGPKPPPKSLPRGRGAFKPSGMDSRFEPGYDPKSDVSLEQDEDRDDWDMALEALRDRAKWQAQGADRLRAAGFTDDEVRKWEKGGDKDFEDIPWNKTGEREWDRGKVVDEDGHVDVKASWT